jgi:hypothetical protein
MPMEPRMITMDGRDPAWTHRAMADLFSRATERNLILAEWELGLFNLRDLEAARAPGFRQREWTRTETFWGCPARVTSLDEEVSLLVIDGSETVRFEAQQGV